MQIKSQNNISKGILTLPFANFVISCLIVLLCQSGLEAALHILRKCVLKLCSRFTGEYSCQNAISIELQCNFIEITLRHGCSPVNFPHIFRTPFPTNISGGLLLQDEYFNPLMSGSKKRSYVLKTFLQLKNAGLFKYL